MKRGNAALMAFRLVGLRGEALRIRRGVEVEYYFLVDQIRAQSGSTAVLHVFCSITSP